MANGGKNGCEYGRTNRLYVEQIQESNKRTHKRIDDILNAVWGIAAGILLIFASVWIQRIFMK